MLAERELLDHRVDPLAAFGGGGVLGEPELGGVGQRPARGQLPVGDGVLGDHPDPPVDLLLVAMRVDALVAHRALAGFELAADQPQQRGLAGSGRADDGHETGSVHTQGDVVGENPAARQLVRHGVDLQPGGVGRVGDRLEAVGGDREPFLAEGDHVARAHVRRGDRRAAYERLVAAAEIVQREAVAVGHETGVMA